MAKKCVLFVLTVVLIAGVFSPLSLAASAALDTSYDLYIKNNKKASTDVVGFDFGAHDASAILDMKDCLVQNGSEYKTDGLVLYTSEGSSVTWKVNIQKSGLYNIAIDYYPVEGRGQDIRREMFIDGVSPFSEAQLLNFSRVWVDEKEIEQDFVGNDLYPAQVQAPRWCFEYFDDDNGYYNEPYLFYFSEGAHTITLNATEEPMVIKTVYFKAAEKLSSYVDALKKYKTQGYEVAKNHFDKIQAEKTTAKSSAMLSAVADRTNPAVEPSDGFLTKLNTLGGGRFNTSGMWVEYVFDAPEKGLYQLSFKVKQNTAKDQNAYRNIYINSKLPFAEAVNFPFEYSSTYKNIVFGNKEGAYLVPLEKGKNTIRLEASLGEISAFCQELEGSLDKLNSAYRKIVTITGTNPDVSRDYSLDTKMPDVIKLFGEHKKKLEDISNRIKETYGQSNSYTATIDALVIQLEAMHDNHYEIAANVSSLNSNLSSLGSTIESMKKSDITLDYLMISNEGYEMPKATANLFKKIVFGVKNLLNSFVADYNSIGVANGEEGIEVWMLGGREQAQVLKQVVDAKFTAGTEKAVNVKLVSTINTLLQATLAGEGPDVATGVGQTDAMNFAFRGATVNLKELKDYNNVSSQFLKSALDVLTYKDGVYGLPQTMDFPVLYYRKDLLNDLGVDVPQTWDDVYALLPILAQNNMAFGLPLSNASESTTSGTGSFGAMLYQRGGSFYTDDMLSSTFSEELTIDVMADWSELYTSYGLPLSYNFVNRFAAGSMPIAVQSYSSYQTLVLYAPHIANLWDWTMIPGTIREDKTIDRSEPITITATLVMKDAENLELAWDFVKWWCSSDIQLEFGTFIENLLGKAGRYNTANVIAMEKIPWSGKLYEGIANQMKWTVAIPEIPGGYYTARYLDNAFRKIYSNRTEDGSEVREVMYEYDRVVDAELEYQRKALQRVNVAK